MRTVGDGTIQSCCMCVIPGKDSATLLSVYIMTYLLFMKIKAILLTFSLDFLWECVFYILS